MWWMRSGALAACSIVWTAISAPAEIVIHISGKNELFCTVPHARRDELHRSIAKAADVAEEAAVT
jgi:hypothetical protein